MLVPAGEPIMALDSGLDIESGVGLLGVMDLVSVLWCFSFFLKLI